MAMTRLDQIRVLEDEGRALNVANIQGVGEGWEVVVDYQQLKYTVIHTFTDGPYPLPEPEIVREYKFSLSERLSPWRAYNKALNTAVHRASDSALDEYMVNL